MTINNKNNPLKNSLSNIEIYQSEDGQARIEIRLERDTLWLSQAQMATLFEKDTDTIGLHLKNIFNEGEVDEKATTEEFSVVRQEGRRQVRRKLRFYNLDAVISVGYQVNSKKGTQFRIWATGRLRDYLLKGYALDQQRFEKNAKELEQALTLIKNPPQPSFKKGGGVLSKLIFYTIFVRTNSPSTTRAQLSSCVRAKVPQTFSVS